MTATDTVRGESGPPALPRVERWMGVERTSARRDGYLDGVRGVAVVAVVAYSAWTLAGRPELAGFGAVAGAGYLGADVFFILSAFLLARPFFDAELNQTPRPSVRPYLVRRLRRIAPAYYVSIIAVVAVFAGTSRLPSGALQGSLGFANLGSLLVFIQNYVPVASGNLNGLGAPWWTLSVQVTWYLLLPIAVVAFMHRRWRWALPIALVVGIGWSALALKSLDPLVDFMSRSVAPRSASLTGVNATAPAMRNLLATQLPAFAVDFAVGLGLARLDTVNRVHPQRLVRWTTPTRTRRAFLAGAVILVVGQLVLHSAIAGSTDHLATWTRPLFQIGLGLILCGLVFGPRQLRRPLEVLPVRFIGWVSYGIYLIHYPILVWLVSHHPIDKAGYGFLVYFAVALAIATVAGTASWLLLERVFLVGPSLSNKPRLVGGLIAATLVLTYSHAIARTERLIAPINQLTMNATYTGNPTLTEAVSVGTISGPERTALEKCGTDPEAVGMTAGGAYQLDWAVFGSAYGCNNATAAALAQSDIEKFYLDSGFVRQPPDSTSVDRLLSTSGSANPNYPVRLKLTYTKGATVVVFLIYAHTPSEATTAATTVLGAVSLPPEAR